MELHYKIGSGFWATIPMELISNFYSALILDTIYGTIVNFYVTAIDVHGLISYFGMEFAPYSYTEMILQILA